MSIGHPVIGQTFAIGEPENPQEHAWHANVSWVVFKQPHMHPDVNECIWGLFGSITSDTEDCAWGTYYIN